MKKSRFKKKVQTSNSFKIFVFLSYDQKKRLQKDFLMKNVFPQKNVCARVCARGTQRILFCLQNAKNRYFFGNPGRNFYRRQQKSTFTYKIFLPPFFSWNFLYFNYLHFFHISKSGVCRWIWKTYIFGTKSVRFHERKNGFL